MKSLPSLIHRKVGPITGFAQGREPKLMCVSGAGGFMPPPLNRLHLLVFQDMTWLCPQVCPLRMIREHLKKICGLRQEEC